MKKLDRLAKYFFYGLIFVSILNASYSHYKAYLGFQPDFYKYYIVSLVGISSSVYFLRTKAKIRINALLFLTSLIVTIYLLDVSIYLQYGDQINPDREAAEDSGISYDRRSRLDVVEELRNKGKYAVFPIQKTSLVVEVDGDTRSIFALGGVANALTITCKESGDWARYRSDRYGFNNPDGTWDKQTDVAMIGDSFVRGWCVDQGKDSSGWLRKFGFNVLNVGMSKTGPLMKLAMFMEYVKQKKPDVVVWNFYERNDLNDLNKEKKNPVLKKYLQKGFTQGLRKIHSSVNGSLKNYHERKLEGFKRNSNQRNHSLINVLSLHHWSMLIDYVKPAIREWLNVSTVDTHPKNPDYELFRRILHRVKNETNDWGGKLIFVYYPAWYRYGNPISEMKYDKIYKRPKTKNVVRSLGVPVLDLHESLFKSSENPLDYFPIPEVYSHYNAKGYKNVAGKISKFLRDHNTLGTKVEE